MNTDSGSEADRQERSVRQAAVAVEINARVTVDLFELIPVWAIARLADETGITSCSELRIFLWQATELDRFCGWLTTQLAEGLEIEVLGVKTLDLDWSDDYWDVHAVYPRWARMVEAVAPIVWVALQSKRLDKDQLQLPLQFEARHDTTQEDAK